MDAHRCSTDLSISIFLHTISLLYLPTDGSLSGKETAKKDEKKGQKEEKRENERRKNELNGVKAAFPPRREKLSLNKAERQDKSVH